MDQILSRTLLVVLLLTASINVNAHHSRAGFDLENETRMTGEVTRLRWTNPHIFLYVTLDNGEDWVFEGHSVAGARGLGWQKDTLEKGDKITVGIYRHLDPNKKFALMNWFLTPAGVAQQAMPGARVPTDLQAEKVVQSRPPGGPPKGVKPSTDFSGNWRADLRGRNLATGSIFQPRSDLPLTAAGQENLRNYDPEENPAYQCLPGTNFAAALGAPYAGRIVRFEDRLEIHKENSTVVFTIWLDKEAARANYVRDRQGLTYGIFRDEHTLFYGTAGFAPSKWGISRGVDSSDQKIVKGRLELGEDGLRISLFWTITDPVYLTEPLHGKTIILKDVDRELEPVPCDPESSELHLRQ